MDRLAEARRPMVRLRGRWVLVDPELARRPASGTCRPLTADRRAGRRADRQRRVDGRAGRGRAERLAGPRCASASPSPTRGASRSQPAGGLAAHPARLPAARAALARPDDLARPRRLPGRRHGPRQDDHADRPAPAPAGRPGDRRADAGGLPGVAARQLGAGDPAGSRPGVPVRAVPRRRPHLDARRARASCSPPTARCALRRRPLARASGAWWSPTRPSTSRTRCRHGARRCGASRRRARVALTGTPVENNLSELWAILDWTTPGLLGTARPRSARSWADPIEADGDAAVAERLSPAGAAVPAAPPQVRPGHRAGAAAEDRDRPARRGSPPSRPRCTRPWSGRTWRRSRTASGIARRGLVLKLLTALKQICNHPAQYLRRDRRRWPGAPASSSCSTSCSTRSSPRAARCWCSRSTWPWRGCSNGTSPTAACRTQLLHGGTPVARREEMVGASRTARCRCSCCRSRPAAPA